MYLNRRSLPFPAGGGSSSEASDHPSAQMILTALSIGKPIDEFTIESPFSQYFVAMFSEVAMAFGIASLGTTRTRIAGAEIVDVSYPGFLDLLHARTS